MQQWNNTPAVWNRSEAVSLPAALKTSVFVYARLTLIPGFLVLHRPVTQSGDSSTEGHLEQPAPTHMLRLVTAVGHKQTVETLPARGSISKPSEWSDSDADICDWLLKFYFFCGRMTSSVMWGQQGSASRRRAALMEENSHDKTKMAD